MPITIGSNIASLLAQRRLRESSSSLASVYERLASGQRINRASDDSAGLAIADNLRIHARVYNQASRNANDGISLLKISESALQATNSIVNRIKELATQAANGVYSNKQRVALNAEGQALRQEYNRILQTTEFNGLKLLDGSIQSISFQVGLDSSEASRITVSTGSQQMGTWDGTFTQTEELLASGRIGSVFAADFNGDGFLDLTSHSDSGGAINFFFGNGDGTFDPRITYGGTGGYQMLGDFDNDGDVDTINRYGGGSPYQIGVNDGSGNFTFSIIGYDNDSGTVGRIATDINGDGNLDFALVLGDESTYVRLGNGDGTFAPAISQSLGISDVSSATFGDINGDGLVDIVMGEVGQNKLYVALGNGDGSFDPVSILGTAPYNSALPTLADINNDGSLDILLSTGQTSKSYAMLNNSAGVFGAAYLITPESLEAFNSTYDINQDGNLDLIRADRTNAKIWTYLGNGDGTFQTATSSATTATTIRNPIFNDFNGDGVTDIAVATYTGNSVIILQGGAVGTAAMSFMPSFSLLTQAESLSTLQKMENLGNQIAARLSTIGASLSRLEIANSHIRESRDRLLESESRIRDADIALESANLLRLQILQKASAAIIAQANFQPGLAMDLLK